MIRIKIALKCEHLNHCYLYSKTCHKYHILKSFYQVFKIRLKIAQKCKHLNYSHLDNIFFSKGEPHATNTTFKKIKSGVQVVRSILSSSNEVSGSSQFKILELPAACSAQNAAYYHKPKFLQQHIFCHTRNLPVRRDSP